MACAYSSWKTIPASKTRLGARALHIHQGGRDTLYRLHGTPEAWSIGNVVSSGCIRLINQNVIHLHDNVSRRQRDPWSFRTRQWTIFRCRLVSGDGSRRRRPAAMSKTGKEMS